MQFQQGHGWFCSNLLAAVPLLVHSLAPPQVGKLFTSQVKPYFYQHLPDNLSGEEEPTPSMENNLCPPLCLKVKAELKDKKKTQCQLFIRQAGPIFRHSL